jgi:hypothetical protein
MHAAELAMDALSTVLEKIAEAEIRARRNARVS